MIEHIHIHSWLDYVHRPCPARLKKYNMNGLCVLIDWDAVIIIVDHSSQILALILI